MRNSTFCFVIVLLFSSLFTFGHTTGIDFQSSWDDVLEQAKQNDQPIFVKTYASYCLPCRMMDQEIFPDSEVSSFFNENFINYKVDMQSNMGQVFTLAYEVQEIPDLLFFNPDGQVMMRSKGSTSKSELLAMGNEVMAQLGSASVNYIVDNQSQIKEEIQTKSNKTEYDNEYAISDFPTTIVSETEEANNQSLNLNRVPLMNSEIVEPKQQNTSISKSASKSNSKFIDMQIIFEAALNVESQAVFTVLKKKKKYYRHFGKEQTVEQLREAAKLMMEEAAKQENPVLLSQAIQVVKRSDLRDKKSFALLLRMNYHERLGEWLTYGKTAKKYIAQCNNLDSGKVFEICNNIVLFSNDFKSFKMASKWMKKQMEEKLTYENQLLYAQLLFKMDNYTKAEKVAKAAFEMAAQESKSNTDCEVLLKEIAYKR